MQVLSSSVYSGGRALVMKRLRMPDKLHAPGNIQGELTEWSVCLKFGEFLTELPTILD